MVSLAPLEFEAKDVALKFELVGFVLRPDFVGLGFVKLIAHTSERGKNDDDEENDEGQSDVATLAVHLHLQPNAVATP